MLLKLPLYRDAVYALCFEDNRLHLQFVRKYDFLGAHDNQGWDILSYFK